MHPRAADEKKGDSSHAGGDGETENGEGGGMKMKMEERREEGLGWNLHFYPTRAKERANLAMIYLDGCVG